MNWGQLRISCAATRAKRLLMRILDIRPARGGEPTRMFQLAVAMWIAFAVVCGFKAVLSPVKHNSYDVFQTGTALWLADLNMYSGSCYEFRYGPVFTTLFSPLTLLPMAVGSLVWMWINVAAFAWALRVLVRDILPGAWTPDREATFLMLALAASYRGFWNAQCNALVFACVVAAMQAILQRRWAWAAVCLALPVHVKVWPVAAALLLIACWPRKLAARFAVALVAVGALPLLIKFPQIVAERYWDWGLAISGPMQTRHAYRDMWTILELVYRPAPSAYALLQISTAMLVLALCLWQRRKSTTEAQLLSFVLGIWTAWQLVFGPGSERNTFGIIAPLTAWGVVTSLAIARGRTIMIAAFVLTILAGIGQFERALSGSFPLAAAAHPLGVLLFAGWLVVHARRWSPAALDIEVATTPFWRREWVPTFNQPIGLAMRQERAAG